MAKDQQYHYFKEDKEITIHTTRGELLPEPPSSKPQRGVLSISQARYGNRYFLNGLFLAITYQENGKENGHAIIEMVHPRSSDTIGKGFLHGRYTDIHASYRCIVEEGKSSIENDPLHKFYVSAKDMYLLPTHRLSFFDSQIKLIHWTIEIAESLYGDRLCEVGNDELNTLGIYKNMPPSMQRAFLKRAAQNGGAKCRVGRFTGKQEIVQEYHGGVLGEGRQRFMCVRCAPEDWS